MTARQRFARIALDRGGLIALATLVLYVWIAPAHIVDGDNAQFATLGALGGAAHPSGYPLYVLWLRATAWLPGATAAHTAAIATAILGAAQMLVLHAACRAWGARATAATFAVAVFAGAPVVLGIYTEAEVFALNGLVVAAVLWLAAAEGPLRGAWRCAVLGLVAGLGLSNHLTCALVAPIGVLGVVRGVRESSLAAAALALLGITIGLAPYAYLVVAPVHAASWGRIEGVGDVVDMILRHDYGGPGAFAGPGPPIAPATSIFALVATLARTWLWLPAIGGLIALGDRVWHPRGETRWGWAMLLASFVLAGPVLASRFNVLPSGVGLYVVDRFHLLPALLLAPAVADLFDRLRRFAPRSASPVIGGVIAVFAFAAIAGTALPHVLRVHAPAVELEVRNTLQSLPANAVVIGENDDVAGGVGYVQLVLGVRRDVTYIHWPMMGLAWYRERVAMPMTSIVRAADDVLASGRPLLVDASERAVLEQFPHYPYGILVRVLVRGATAPSLDDVFAINKLVYAGFTLGYELPGTDDEWPTAVHRKYARTWQVLGVELDAAGKHDDAAWAFAAARQIGPQ